MKVLPTRVKIKMWGSQVLPSVTGCDSLLIFLKVRGSRYRLVSQANQRVVAVMLEVDPCTLPCPNCGADLQPAVHRFVSFKDLFRWKCFECGLDVTGDEMLQLFDSLEYQLRQFRPGE